MTATDKIRAWDEGYRSGQLDAAMGIVRQAPAETPHLYTLGYRQAQADIAMRLYGRAS